MGRAGFGPGRKKSGFFCAEKIVMTFLWDVAGLSFRGGLGLGRTARVFYSVK
jgi:hypothetical protein